ncbi:hypothetical protein SOPP22_16100 [Shewanella sp. OPT22]|nr:hypothetical protein SOPP22_16100 [Shewanella sp. OPT22]
MSSIALMPQPKNWGTRSISDQRVQEAIRSKADGVELKKTRLEKIKDWFCCTDTLQVLECICTLKLEQTPEEQHSDTLGEGITAKFRAHHTLASLIGADHRDKVTVSIDAGENPDTHKVTFGITGLDVEFPPQFISIPPTLITSVEKYGESPKQRSDEEYKKAEVEYETTSKKLVTLQHRCATFPTEDSTTATKHVTEQWKKLTSYYETPLQEKFERQLMIKRNTRIREDRQESIRCSLNQNSELDTARLFSQKQLPQKRDVIHSDLKKFEPESWSDFTKRVKRETDSDLHPLIEEIVQKNISHVSTYRRLNDYKKEVSHLFAEGKTLDEWSAEAMSKARVKSCATQNDKTARNELEKYIKDKKDKLKHGVLGRATTQHDDKTIFVHEMAKSLEKEMFEKGIKYSDADGKKWQSESDKFLDTQDFEGYNAQEIKSEVKALIAKRRALILTKRTQFLNRLAEKKANKPADDEAPKGFVTMSSPSTLGRQYYFDTHGVFPPIRKPESPSIKKENRVSGAFKTLEARDEHFVKLGTSLPYDQTIEEKPSEEAKVEGRHLSLDEANELKRKQLIALKEALGVKSFHGTSISPGMQGIYTKKRPSQEVYSTTSFHKVTVDKAESWAVNGGTDVESFVASKGPIRLQAYKQLCYDVQKAHDHDIYFRDLKNCNLMYKDKVKAASGVESLVKDPKVMLIDIDDVVTPKFGREKHLALGTYLYSTKAFQEEIQAESDDKERCKLRKQADNYALLLSILFGTSPQIASVIPRDSYGKLPIAGFISQFGGGKTSTDTIENAIRAVVIPEKFEAVKLFLTCPTKNRLEESIHDVIAWKDPSKDIKPAVQTS